MNEAETRRTLIDKRLRLAGWDVEDPSQIIRELDIHLADAGFPVAADRANPYAGHQFADYALLLHGKPIAVVEAKRTSKDAALGQEQALQYATNLQKIHGGRIPFVSYTNGYNIFFWESDFYPPVKVHGFPTRDDLEWMDLRRQDRKPLSVELITTDIAGRDYQIAAIRSILECVEAKRRKFLLVMATGTGKTRTAVALLDVLTRARWAKRVLFLVDRIPLRDQALDAFKEHIPAEPRWPQPAERVFARDRRVYVTTYPAMLNLIHSGTTPASWISPHFFDVIIADESHRSIYNTYLQVLNYFNAIRLGLTATPTDRIDHDTLEPFDCETHDPTFAYSYEEAIAHDPPYLCDFEVLKVRSKFQLEGIKGGTLPPAVQKKLIAEGKDIEDIDFEGTDIERKVTNSGTNALIVREFMEECIKDQSGTLPGKGGLLDQFKNRDRPRVAISVDMLDTGVDIREVVNLVFAKPVYSYTKFWQMIGRGTRVLDADPNQRKPWCPQKDRFLIIDCWGNFEFFKMKPRGREPGPHLPLPVRLFTARLDKLEASMATGHADIAESIKTDLRSDLATLPSNNVVVLDKQADLAKVEPDQFWQHLRAEDMGLLRVNIAPILRARSEADFKAMRFEMDVVELGTALLAANEAAFDAFRESIVAQVSELPLTVNVVAKERNLIEQVQHSHWWATEVHELALLLEQQSPHVTEALFRKMYDHKSARFIEFIQHILGLRELESWSETVTKAFDGFITQHTTLSALQIQFLQTLRTFILQTGRVQRRDLIEAPFTRLHPKGVRGVFTPGEIEDILQLTGKLVEAA